MGRKSLSYLFRKAILRGVEEENGGCDGGSMDMFKGLCMKLLCKGGL